eukprot:8072299-Ditylum_brightwellii.AAC.1
MKSLAIFVIYVLPSGMGEDVYCEHSCIVDLGPVQSMVPPNKIVQATQKMGGSSLVRFIASDTGRAYI